MAAKVDNRTVQDGYTLYHHVILFDKNGDWSVIQQGMNTKDMTARRYHWISDIVKSFTCEPHAGIISNYKNLSTLNMSSINSKENQKVSLELATGNTENLKSSVREVVLKKDHSLRMNGTLDDWMPRSNLAILLVSFLKITMLMNTMKCLVDWTGVYSEKFMIFNLGTMSN